MRLDESSIGRRYKVIHLTGEGKTKKELEKWESQEEQKYIFTR